MRAIQSALAVSALALIVSCSGVKVQSGVNPVAAAAFASISTYDWVSGAMSDGDDVHLADQIESAVDANLAVKGLRRVSGGAASPDMLVAQYTSVELKWIRHDPYYAAYELELTEQGTLVIEFIDPASRQVLWHGTGQRQLRVVGEGNGLMPPWLLKNPEPRDWKVQQMVNAILADFPREVD